MTNDSSTIQVGGFGQQLADKTADGTKQPLILQNITVRPVNRQSQDIGKWRQAHRAAEGYVPRRVLLYDLYSDVMLDGHVIACTGKRIDAVTLANWQFVGADGKPVDAINHIIDSLGFEDLITEIVKSKFWGYSMIECGFFKNRRGQTEMTAFQCDRKHMRPDTGIITIEQNADTGINIREGIYPSFILEAGKEKDLGLLLSVAQYAILKDGDFSDWTSFVQTYGQPIVSAEWDGFDESQRIKFLKSLEGLGPGGSITHPSGSKIELLESRANADGGMQDKLKDALNAEISKGLLGATEGVESSNSSGYAQSETHAEAEDDKQETDINFVRRVLNSRYINILEDNGINTAGGKFVIADSKKQLPKDKAYTIHKSMVSDLDIPISDDFFYEEYNVPKPDDYETQKAALLATKAQNQAEGMPQPGESAAPTPPAKSKDKGQKSKDAPPSPGAPPPKKKLAKLREMLSFFSLAPATKTTGATMTACCGSHQPVIDRFVQLADKSNPSEAFIKAIYNAGGKLDFDASIFAFTAQALLDGIDGGWHNKPMVTLSDLGFDYGVDDPGLLTAFELNLFRFAGVKTLAQAQELNKLFREATSFEDFYKKAIQVTDVFNKVWLQTECNTAYFTGEASATYFRLLKQVKTFAYWEYRTVGDDKVRPAHAALNGLILPANDPRWDKIFPPNGWNCRCWVVPRTKAEVQDVYIKQMRARADAYFETAEYKTDAAQGWGVNRAKTGEVFTADQQYIRKFEGKASKMLNNLSSADFGLKAYSQAKKAATADMPEFDGTADDFFKGNLKDGIASITDYNKRPLQLDEGSFNAHTTGKKESRVLYLEAMQETVKKPDEVWVNGDKLGDLVYIKYYNDETVVVIADVTKGNVTEVKTWFPLKESKDVIDKFRRGLLIFGAKK